MKLIRGNHNLSQPLQGAVVTLGNFDGMHLGHQALLNKLNAMRESLNLPSIVITFEPQPKEFFAKRETVPRLMRFCEKWLALKDYNIDYVFCLRFNQALASLSPEAFVKKILIDQLNAKVVIVGDDFRFGAKRAGDYAQLKQLGDKYGFQTIEMPTIMVDNERVSSTRVREALEAGDLNAAEKLLGRPYRLYGKVGHGDRLGRDLGYPTANVNLHRDLVPLGGIFVIRVYGLGDHPYEGVANVGTRPMVGGTRILLEAHLFDFNAEIYGHNIEVEFLHKLRDEERYDTLEELVEHIHQDVIDAKNYFRHLA
ncbi:bifunctional riboflavin kinase/FAD synthetase [Candidiatus Paracoxiella cheracis]|uniref:bifunctional riboflavin kinase/FAD synthetase n=1 Tax=Candidiatus Paracoxiella cheracis TaxID=3405120 RepID=UPI003BF5A82A